VTPSELAHAIERARAGERGPARALIERRDALPSALAVVTARLAMVLREHDRALEILEACETEVALEWRIGLEARLGRYHAALRRADEAAARAPSERRLTWAARLHAEHYDDQGALAILAQMDSGWSAREAFRLGRSLPLAERAFSLARDRAEQLRIVRELAGAGHPREAESMLERMGERAELALFALRRGDLAEARARADDSQTGRMVRGGIALFSGDPRAAVQLLEGIEEAEAHVLRAEALERLERLDEAEAALACANRDIDGSSEYLASIAVRALVRREPLASQMAEEGIGEAARALVPDDPTDPRKILAALRGDRSLAAYPVPPSSRTLSRWAQRRIEHASIERTLAGFDEVIRRYPESSIPYCYRGEVQLWVGDWERAEADFERAIAMHPRTFWAWVGRAAVQIMRGEPREALRTLDQIVRTTAREGPTLYVYRGEARRLVGDLDGAVRDLEHSRHERESRTGAWLNLGLARVARGEKEEARKVLAHLRRHAAALLADAARSTGASPELADEREIEPVFRAALRMSRGNRSSGHRTYFVGDELRFVSRDVFDDDEELALLAGIVDRLLGRSPLLSQRS
jgi:tetratricopeptide (TPR) repeat protein